jgi:hypothetical protein
MKSRLLQSKAAFSMGGDQAGDGAKVAQASQP